MWNALGKCTRLEILRAAQHLAHLVGRPRLDLGVELDAQHRDVLDQRRLIVGAAHREASVARLTPGIAVSAMARAHVFDARFGQRPQFLGARQPDALDDRVDPLGKSRRHEPAIAARRAARDPIRLQHRDRPAAPRDLARDRQPGKPGADDADIDIEIVGERRPLRRRNHGCGVPGRPVWSWLGRHRPLMPRRHLYRKPPACRVLDSFHRNEALMRRLMLLRHAKSDWATGIARP